MSVSIATMGMFNTCCGGVSGGGGAPPYRQNATERAKPFVSVTSFEMKTKDDLKKYLDKIQVKLIDVE